jgi:PAS domain S-box-containing protein
MNHDPAAMPSSETRFREVFDQAPISMQLIAANGRTLQVNKAWEKLWQGAYGDGLKQHVLHGDFNILTDPQLHAKGVTPFLVRAFAGESVEIPPILYDPNELGIRAEPRWVTAVAHPIKDQRGQVVEIMLMHQDITDRVRAEEALRASEHRMRLLFDSTPQKMFTATPTGEVDYFNPAWAAFTGLPAGALLDWGWTRFIHPDDLDPNLRTWQRCIETGEPYHVEHRFRRFDGEHRWHLSRAVPMRDEAGAIVGWIGSNTDIHEVKAAETELARRLEAEQHHSSVLARIAAASHALHASPSIDDSARDLAGRVRDLLQTHRARLCLYANDDGVRAIDAVSDSGLYAGQQQAPDDTLAVPLVGHDGARIGVLEATGKLEGRFTVQDHAILAQLAAIAATGFENARLYGSLQEQHQRKDEFLAMLAHELRNPLAPIRAAADLLSLPNVAHATIRQTSAVIGRQVQHLSSLVDDLLDVSRVTRGLIELSTAVLDIRAVVADAVEQVRPLVQARGHELAVLLSEDCGEVSGDHKRLVQILTNILNNAAKYTPRGGRIIFTAETNRDEVVLSVRDNGIGIAPELQSKVFNLFAQAERSSDRSQGGLGIGLALVKSLVHLHGGSVACHSEGAGRGSRFVVTLPRLQPRRTAQTGPGEQAPLAATSRRRVLVVDDNVDAADMLAMCLEVAGHSVAVEHRGNAALQRAIAEQPDACVLDIGLPDLDGYALARRLRAHPGTAKAMLIAVTGYGSDQDKENAIAAGFDHHIVKPADSQLLAALVGTSGAQRN